MEKIELVEINNNFITQMQEKISNIAETNKHFILQMQNKMLDIENDLKNQSEKYNHLNNVLNVIVNHLSIVEKKQKKFSDKFKFWNKSKNIKDELADFDSFKEATRKTTKFSLNDDDE